ncbi:hypothetical protein P692DRAFT_20721946 [Suillus brevipes Sb2]|nr:hypothetical protein P692DRAFT_20721946 [Suillus brevipes Sb2]
MSRTSIPSNRSRRPTQEGNMDGAHDQSIRLDDRPLPQNNALPQADKGEENSGPSEAQQPVSLEISNSVPPRPSEPYIQGHTSGDLPEGGLAA